MKTNILFIFYFLSFFSYTQNQNENHYLNISKNSYKKIDYDSISKELLKLINNYRSQNQLNELTLDETQNAYTKNWAKKLILGEVEGHSNINLNGYVCENIFTINSIGTPMLTVESLQKTTTKIFNGWVKSPSHNENLLTKNVNTIGIGIETSLTDTYKLKCVMVMK